MRNTEAQIAEYREMAKQARINERMERAEGEHEEANAWAATAREHDAKANELAAQLAEAREEHEAFRARHARRIAAGDYRH